jgi:hypothetical protein
MGDFVWATLYGRLCMGDIWWAILYGRLCMGDFGWATFGGVTCSPMEAFNPFNSYKKLLGRMRMDK